MCFPQLCLAHERTLKLAYCRGIPAGAAAHQCAAEVLVVEKAVNGSLRTGLPRMPVTRRSGIAIGENNDVAAVLVFTSIP